MQAVYSPSGTKVAPADLSTRLLAFTIDALLLLTLIGVADYLTISSNEQALLLKPERLLHLLLGWLYFAGAETCTCQATLGKYLLGLKVSSTTGEKLSFRCGSIRYFAKPITVFLILMRFLRGNAVDTHSTFHDRLAHAQVILR